jgi:hypothetical protein
MRDELHIGLKWLYLEAEHDDAVIEFYDQPPPIPLEYLDTHGRLQRAQHTADYFVFRYQSAGWEECKPTQELIRQAQTRPNRYRLDEVPIIRMGGVTWRKSAIRLDHIVSIASAHMRLANSS